MLFRVLHHEAGGQLTYLLADADAGETVLIDPRSADIPVLQAMLDERRLRLRWVLRTHNHDTEMPGELARLAALNAPLVQGHPNANAQRPADGTSLCFGDEHVRVMDTPGHTGHCLSYVWRDRVFCGDLLNFDACPHQPTPAQPSALWDSVTQRIFTLPDETLLFAGHERQARAVSTVLSERRWHPHFAGLTRDEFLARMAVRGRAAAQAQANLSTSPRSFCA